MVDTTGDAVDLGGEKKDDSPGKQEQGQENLPPVLGKQEQAPIEEVADVPDPDEDDLDDLDDMLDEFSAVKVDDKKPEPPSLAAQPSTAGPSEAEKLPSMDDLLSDSDFAQQLQAGMADLLGDLDNSSEMKAQFESIFKELDTAASAGASSAQKAAPVASTSSPAAGAGVGTDTDASFQETIRRTMERMQASGEQATAAATAGGSDDFMAELLKQMQSEGGLEGEGNDEELSKMLMGMMEQLTNKEILYDPMKELNEKFPAWLEKNKGATSKDDLARYEEQQSLVKEIVAKFEEPTYADSNAADREYIVDRMQKMQAAGSPPADLVGDMPSAQEAFNAPDESCNPQ